MEENESCLFMPMWLFGIGLVILSLVGCSRLALDVVDCEEEPLVHTCPEQGHGECPICPSRQKSIDLSILDYHCIDCELVYEYGIFLVPESNNEKVVVLD